MKARIYILLACLSLCVNFLHAGPIPYLDSLFEYNYRRFEKQFYQNELNKSLGREEENNYVFVFDENYSKEGVGVLREKNGQYQLDNNTISNLTVLNNLISTFNLDTVKNTERYEIYNIIIFADKINWTEIGNLDKLKKSSEVIKALDDMISKKIGEKNYIELIKSQYKDYIHQLTIRANNLVNKNSFAGKHPYKGQKRILIDIGQLPEVYKDATQIKKYPNLTIIYDWSSKNVNENTENLVQSKLNGSGFELLTNMNEIIFWYNQKIMEGLLQEANDPTKFEDIHFWEKYSELTLPSEIIANMQTETLETTKGIELYLKLSALKKLFDTGSDITGRNFAIIKLIAGTPSSLYNEMLSFLKTKVGINKIFNEFDTQNLTEISLLISGFITYQNPSLQDKEIAGFLSDTKKILYLEGDLLKFSNLEYEFSDKSTFKFNGNQEYDFDKLLPIIIASSFDVEGEKFHGGSIIVMPAITAAMYGKLNDLKRDEAAAWLALDALSFSVGLGEINIFLKAGNWIRKTIVLGDLVGSSLGITVQLLDDRVISDSLRYKIQLASIALSMPVLITSLPKIGKVIDEMCVILESKLLREQNVLQFTNIRNTMTKRFLLKSGMEEKIVTEYSDELISIVDNGCGIGCKLKRYGCFTSGTKVQTSAGPRKIETLNTGDSVLSYNHMSKKKEIKYISAIKRQIVAAIMMLVMSNGDILWATTDHPFFINGKYVAAQELNPGDQFSTYDGSHLFLKEKLSKDTSIQVYNLTVADNANYYVGQNPILVHNTCFLNHLDEYPTLKATVNDLDEGLKGEFIKDFFKAGDDVLDKLNASPGMVSAWDIFIAHPLIRKDVATLTSASKILDNTGIANIISKIDLQTTVQKLAEKGVRCRTCTSGNPAYRYMDEILDDLEHGATKFGNEYTSVITGFKQGGNFTEGAMFVADAVRRYGDDFPAGTLFEFTEATTGGVRRVDVRVVNTFYEFKSVASLPPSGFADQFVKDLNLGEVTQLDQLKWWFDGNKVSSLPKQQFLEALANASVPQNIVDNLNSKFGGSSWDDIVDLIDNNFDTIFNVK